MTVPRILLTGGSGFVGNHLASKLAEQKDVDLYSLERYVTSRYVLGQSRNIKTVFGDLKDYHAIKQVIREVQPDIVVHLAAISAVSYSYDHPHEVIETNFLGTVNLAEVCLHEIPHFKHFLFAATSEEYGTQERFPIKEDAELRPNSPYSVSKVAADKYLRYMWDAYQFPITILRPFNTYGRKDNTHFVVERIVSQMLKGNEVKLGDPDAVRDFLYVDDHVNAYLTCLKNEKAIGETFNFSTGEGTQICILAKMIARLTKFKGNIIWHTIPKRPLDIKKLVGDYGKAKGLLGWEPKFMLEQGLAHIIEHWKNVLEGKQN